MLGNFNPSYRVDDIFNLLEDYTAGIDIYKYEATDAVVDYLCKTAKTEYNLACSAWPNMEGGVCAISFLDENGHPQLVVFDYEY